MDTTILTKEQYFQFAGLAQIVIDSPIKFNYVAGNETNNITLVSGEYSHEEKAIRGRDIDGRIWYIPSKNIVTVEF